jgi:hypothetical protein
MPYGTTSTNTNCGGFGQPRCGSIFDTFGGGSSNGGGGGLILNPDGTIWLGGNAPSGDGNIRPQTTITNSGAVVNNTVLDKTLNAVLAGLALLKGANKIPTTLDPSDGYGGGRNYSAAELAYLQSQSVDGGGGNTAGRVEAWIKNHTGATVVIALVGAALFLPPLTGSKKR